MIQILLLSNKLQRHPNMMISSLIFYTESFTPTGILSRPRVAYAKDIPFDRKNAVAEAGGEKEISSFSGNLQKSLAMERKKRYNRRKTFFSA